MAALKLITAEVSPGIAISACDIYKQPSELRDATGDTRNVNHLSYCSRYKVYMFRVLVCIDSI